MSKQLLAVCAAALFLASCGGGGTSSGPSGPSGPGPATPPTDDIRTQPGDRTSEEVYPSHSPGQSVDVALLSAGTAHGTFDSFYGKVDDGTDAATLTKMLTTDEQGTSILVDRWADTPPTVHAASGMTAAQFEELRLIVGLLNSALPKDWQLTLSSARIDMSNKAQPDEGTIIVDYTTSDTWPSTVVSTAVGYARTHRMKPNLYVAAEVFVDPERLPDEAKRLKTLAHEMLHALGRAHVDPAAFPYSLMPPSSSRTVPGIIPKIDNEALLAVYEFLEAGDDATAVATALGSWETESTHYALEGSFAGGTGEIVFGALERNDHARPWAWATPLPHGLLASNAQLSGSATWTGRLAGLTPTSEAVAGAAELVVDISALTGDLDFTGLESWAAGLTPGAVGTGAQWADGDLNYRIRVTENAFSRTGGDEGTLEGAFAGHAHEAMFGVLTRADLSAGFGGIR